jgi:RNA polymerase sigma-70 factor (ECF subfamily)
MERRHGGEQPVLDLAALYRDLHPALLRHIRHTAPGAAEDLAADVWAEATAGFGHFHGDATAFAGWLFTLARRRVIDAQRRTVRRRTDPVDGDDFDSRPGADRPESDTLDRLSAGAAMARVAGMLTPAQAEVVLLRVVAGLPVERVAEITGRPQGAVRGLQHRALRRLAGALPREALTA